MKRSNTYERYKRQQSSIVEKLQYSRNLWVFTKHTKTYLLGLVKYINYVIYGYIELCPTLSTGYISY
jgi:hypothetical protein